MDKLIFQVQMRLYTYLATEFVTYNGIYHLIQPITEIIQTLHTIKYFYWIVDPSHRSGYKPKGTGKRKFLFSMIKLPNKYRRKSANTWTTY